MTMPMDGIGEADANQNRLSCFALCKALSLHVNVTYPWSCRQQQQPLCPTPTKVDGATALENNERFLLGIGV
jgi:hypothetical protein